MNLQLIASLLWLESQSSKEPITLYFNSPGALGKPVTSFIFLLFLFLKFLLILIYLSFESGVCSLRCDDQNEEPVGYNKHGSYRYLKCLHINTS